MESRGTEIGRLPAAELLELAPVLFVWLDSDGRVRHVNRYFESLTGWTSREAEGRDWFSLFVPEDDRDRVRTMFRRTIEGHETTGTIHRLRTRGGAVRQIEWKSIADTTGQGGVYTFGRDVTERQDAARLEAQAEQRLRALLDGLFAFVGVYGLDGTLLDANRAALESAGFERQDVIGARLWEAGPWVDAPATQARLKTMLARAAQGEVVREDLPARTGGGRNIVIDAMFGPLRDARGRIEHLVGCGVDITRRKEIEEALSAGERQLSAIYANAPVIIFYVVVEPGGTFCFKSINQAFLEATGLRADQVVGRLVEDVIPKPAHELVFAKYREAIETKQTVHWEEISVYPSGTKVGEVSVAPDVGPDGTVEHLIGIVHDLTGRRAAEEGLRAANAQLLDADRRKTEFLAVLSHELRNPLAALRLSTDILKRVSDPAKVRRACEVIDRQTEHMARLIDDLLDVTRISRGKISLRKERVELNGLAHAVVDDHHELFAHHAIALTIVDADQPLYAEADATRLNQAIGNLLHNSAKFTPRDGHVILSIEVEDPGHVLIRVRDDGEGIAPESLPHVFEPFVQVQQPLDRSRGGLGLGLALVKGLVEMHGGDVWAESAGLGRGAQFSIRLPLQERAVVPRAAAETGAREGTRRVLVVEDNVDVAEGLRAALELCNHEVDVAYSAPVALEKARTFKPDLVLCDIGLPQMDGYALARAMRADPQLRDICLVAVSGYALPENLEASRAAGFSRHLAKPVGLSVLEELLAEVPSLSRQRTDAQTSADISPTW